MEKRFFWAIDLHSPATLHRFPSRRQRTEWIGGNPYRGEVGNMHPAFFQVRRIQRRMAQGEQITFPVEID